MVESSNRSSKIKINYNIPSIASNEMLSIGQMERNAKEPRKSIFHITRRLSHEHLNSSQLIYNLWKFMFNYNGSEEYFVHYDTAPILLLLRRTQRILSSEPTLLDINGKVVIMGDIHGHGDSLLTLFSLAGLPPNKVYIFLGNYSGCGFAPHETLFLLLAFKIRYPKQIYLLRGSSEDADVLTAQGFVNGLYKRNLNRAVWIELIQCLELLPLAALIEGKYFCVHGGIGQQLMAVGLKGLRKVNRPPRSLEDLAITTECQWASYKSTTIKGDGSPLFGDEDLNNFCEQNNIYRIIRGRQIVNNGILNMPERMFTIWSAASYLDAFRNFAAILKIDPAKNSGTILRFNIYEPEPQSLDDFRPVAARNAFMQ